MSCTKGHSGGSCVCTVLKNIANAQRDIIENVCDTSCDKSISDLLGDTDIPNDLDTVPVLLYCKDSCKPFKGYGIHPRHMDNVLSSFYFRVKSVTNDCCAVLELLRDPNDTSNPCDPCEQHTGHLRTTGICITVDVNCFCHITCLPAVRAF